MLAAAAYYNFLAAALSTLPVIATGILAWQFQLEARKIKGILLQHLVLACVASAMMWLVWFLQFRARRASQDISPSYHLSLELLTMFFVMLTGHLGGFLSGVNGPG